MNFDEAASLFVAGSHQAVGFAVVGTPFGCRRTSTALALCFSQFRVALEISFICNAITVLVLLVASAITCGPVMVFLFTAVFSGLPLAVAFVFSEE